MGWRQCTYKVEKNFVRICKFEVSKIEERERERRFPWSLNALTQILNVCTSNFA